MNILTDLTDSPIPLSKIEIENTTRFILEFEEVQCDEVSLHFLDKAKIAKLHNEYFQDPSVTDCITFPIDDPRTSNETYSILGEIFVCPEVAVDYSKEHHIDPSKELTLYVIHGLLHLIGYGDIKESERKIMRLEEKRVMNAIEKNHLLITMNIFSSSVH